MSAKKPVKRRLVSKKYHVSAKDREYFTSNLALLLKAGVAVGEGLTSLAETSHSRTLKRALNQIKNDINDGTSLWHALERSGVVGKQTLALVQIGEQSGKLIENLQVAAQQEEKQRIFRTKLRSALIYPIFVMSLTVLVGIAVAWFLLPKLADTFGQLKIELPLISKIFIGFGTFLKDNGLWAVPLGLSASVFILYIIFVAPITRSIGQSLLYRTPGISRLMYEIEIARFGYLLGTLLGAGLSIIQALNLLEQATNARRYQKFYHYLRGAFDNGYSMHTSLAKYKRSRILLPPAVQQMIIAGERSGALPDTLTNVGKIYEQKSDVSTQNLEAILEPIMLIIVWLGVMGVAVAVILPVYGLIGGLDT